jgi:hypothetical protein
MPALGIACRTQEWQQGTSRAPALGAAQRRLRDGITSGPDLRDRLLPELLRDLDSAWLRRRCRDAAEWYARR